MRNIDCFLTDEEQTAIKDYIFKGERENILKEIELKKYVKIDQQLSKLVPNTALTYRKYLEKNEITCPLETFLTAFSSTLEDEKNRLGHHGLLDNLKIGIDECGASCPCPADCN